MRLLKRNPAKAFSSFLTKLFRAAPRGPAGLGGACREKAKVGRRDVVFAGFDLGATAVLPNRVKDSMTSNRGSEKRRPMNRAESYTDHRWVLPLGEP